MTLRPAHWLAVLAIAFVLAPGARAEPWSDTDSALLATALTLHAADWSQTRYVADHPDRWHERNPLLGRHPSRDRVDLYFAGTALAMAAAAHVLPQWRRSLLWGYVAVGAVSVGRNFAIGLRVGSAW